jgi:hypothetical protein
MTRELISGEPVTCVEQSARQLVTLRVHVLVSLLTSTCSRRHSRRRTRKKGERPRLGPPPVEVGSTTSANRCLQIDPTRRSREPRAAADSALPRRLIEVFRLGGNPKMRWIEGVGLREWVWSGALDDRFPPRLSRSHATDVVKLARVPEQGDGDGSANGEGGDLDDELTLHGPILADPGRPGQGGLCDPNLTVGRVVWIRQRVRSMLPPPPSPEP